jgi:Ser-tRNA(Ala) deacylase AlaX
MYGDIHLQGGIYMNENQIFKDKAFTPPRGQSINESLEEIEAKLDALAKEINSLDEKFITNKKFEELVRIVKNSSRHVVIC